MQEEKNAKAAKVLLKTVMKTILEVTQTTDETDEVDIEVSFSPQVFNPDRKHTRRRLFFVITACIIPENMNKETHYLPPKEKKAFPDIEVKGKLKSFVINKTCDAPKIDGIQFSSGQVEQIANYIRSEQEIELTFTQLQQELQFDDD